MCDELSYIHAQAPAAKTVLLVCEFCSNSSGTTFVSLSLCELSFRNHRHKSQGNSPFESLNTFCIFGRLVDSQLLQVMSPKMHSVKDVDVPMEQAGLGPQGGQIDIVTRMIVTPADVVASREGLPGMPGATRTTSQSHPLSDTPVKVHLRREVGEYKEALQQSHVRGTQHPRLSLYLRTRGMDLSKQLMSTKKLEDQ